MTLQEASRQYQCALEFERRDPDDDEAQEARMAAEATLFEVWMEER